MNFLYPFVVLILLIVVFHAVLIYGRPQSKKFWKRIDYFWVSLGFIGIIGSMTSLRKEFSTARTNYFEQPLIFSYDGLTESAGNQYKYFSDTINGFKYSEFNDQKQAKSFIKAGQFFEWYSKDILRYRDTILVDKYLNYIDTLSLSYDKFLNSTDDRYVQQVRKSTGFYLDELKGSKKEYLENDDLLHKSSLEWILLFIAPYLLAGAIDIRLTKVTAEIKELK
ncbi:MULTISPECIES: hypothetical protein [unclassified Chryseobacterium]|uniref:hypothetical protein n=1 Tax=unclassified Chryseobacterium TaxID=2593645 RepID=UPI002269C60F|nr:MULTISPECIES: hypothetical protein [unclassified Chryseobacterium]